MATTKSVTVTGITTGVSWTAASNQAWCTITGGSGAGNGSFTVQCATHTSTDTDRTAILTVTPSDGGTPAILTVTQRMRSSAAVNPNAITFDAAGNVLS
jgi:putative protein kinase ArgK-like GTPase of G3E family